MKKTYLLILSIPFLFAFHCSKDELNEEFIYNVPTAVVNHNSPLEIGDTIWIYSKVSANKYSLESQDSVFNEIIPTASYTIGKFQQEQNFINAINALDSFNFISTTGFLDNPNQYTSYQGINASLSNNGTFYEYKIGVIALKSGDFFIHNSFGEFINSLDNSSILTSYPTSYPDTDIVFKSSASVTNHMSNSNKIYFFSVN